jgi:hypothetical protein
MAKWSEQYPSKYLKAADWPQGSEANLVIDYIERQAMTDSDDEKPVLFFVGKQKGLVLNVSNGNELAEAYGDDLDAWQGKPCILYRTTTMFAGKRVPALRLRIPEDSDVQPARQPQSDTDAANALLHEAAETEASDEVPF